MSTQPTVGFIGVGNMGWPMAACLVNKGFTVLANDFRREVANNFVQQVGGTAPDSLKQLAEGADVIVTMLPTSAIVEHVLAGGDDNVFAGMKPGTIVIDMSSGVPSHTQRLAEKVAALGGIMIDAPVSGGVPRAKTGQLAIMVGGEAAVIERVKPVLAAMGTSILRAGDVGAGQAVKALNNMVSTGGFLIGIEALLVGQRFGLDAGVMTDVLNAATGMNNSTQKKFRQFVLSRKFDAGFTMGLLAKDLSIAMQIGRETGTATPLSALVREMIVSAETLFGPGSDHTEMAKWCERLVGEELKAD